MSKEIIVNANLAEEIRIAILEDGRLVDLDYETQSRAKHRGNIYKGIVTNIEDGLNAAFIEIGEDKQAFLPLTEIRPSMYPPEFKGQKKVKISDILVRGQEIVVQVTKDEIGTKGAAVSTYLSLPGRYVVLMHSDDSGGGISRKIESSNARESAREMLAHLNVPEGMAVIIRTAGVNIGLKDLYRDFQVLCEAWHRIDKGAQLGRAPTLLYREPDIVIRTIRDYFTNDVQRIVIDDEEEFEDASNYFKDYMPDLVQFLELHRKKEPIFQTYGIEQAIEELFERQVKLPSGGYVIIEQTEALVSIDVNSGKSTKEEDHEATAFKTNLEAAAEVACQLRLRDLGGIIVVDFIDMLSRKHKRDVENALREYMRNDKARVKVGYISENGTLELTRQRIRQSHSLISHVPCFHCSGTGRVRDAEGLALSAVRKIGGYLAKKRVALSKLIVTLPVDVANVVSNRKRQDLMHLSELHGLGIDIIGNNILFGANIEFAEERRGHAGLTAQSQSKQRNESSGQNKQTQKWPIPAVPLPPPSIGPLPELIKAEELPDFDKSPEPSLLADHFSDPLEHALFGLASNANSKPAQSTTPQPKLEKRLRTQRNRNHEQPRKWPKKKFEQKTLGEAQATNNESSSEHTSEQETSTMLHEQPILREEPQ